ncbi:MAG TPA: hypothetical protein PKH95_02080 [Candidatus Magasanikbacteria bacterium]|nr:hypothetical protein [Candidatus Magasanikbacteria bacterium]
MQKLVSIIVMTSMMLGGLFLVTNSVLAAEPAPTGLIDTDSLGVSYGAKIGLGTQDVRTTVASIIRVAMGLLGIVAVVIILIGGFYWMTAGGDEGRVETGKKWIFSGIIGLAIILSAYALANFVISSLVGATTGTATF